VVIIVQDSQKQPKKRNSSYQTIEEEETQTIEEETKNFESTPSSHSSQLSEDGSQT